MTRTDEGGPEWQLNAVIKHTLQLKNDTERVRGIKEQLMFNGDGACVNRISPLVPLNTCLL